MHRSSPARPAHRLLARLGLAIVAAILLGGSTSARADFDYKVYTGSWSVLPDFDSLTPVETGTSTFVGTTVTTYTDNFGLVFTIQIDVPTTGDYEFYTNSDDGSKLYIDGSLVVSNDGLHGPATVQNVVTLSAGPHDLRIEFFEKGGGQVIEAGYRNGNPSFLPIPADGQLEYFSSNESTFGKWGSVIQWPHIAISAANLPDGRILSWSSTETNAFPSGPTFTHASVFDPTDESFLNADSNFHDMFCAGISTLEDGTILASGGNPSDRRTSSFDPDTLEWSPRADMIDRRWYATSVTLPDNRVFASFGKDSGNRSEVYDPATNTWTATPNVNMQTLVDEQNAIQSAPNPTGALNHEWWSHLTVAPQGDLMMAGPTQTWHRFDPIGGADNVVLGQMIGDTPRMYGNAVNYGEGKFMLIGGADRRADPPTTVNNVYLIDLNGPAPILTQGAPMNFPRALSNSVTLPDGRILVIGGNTVAKIFSDEGSVLPAEIYDPASDTWTVVDSITIPRNYHSTALLLKDGRVLSAGGGACGNCLANHLDGQTYSPPYLFESDDTPATRPTLSVPANPVVHAGEDLVVTASPDTTAFSIVRLSATTHHLNTDQRFLPLAHVDNGDGTFTVSFPANPNVLIVGNYWLFALDADGTPSIGETINVQRAFVPPPAPEGGAYVSDLVWESEQNGLGPAERDRSNGDAGSADGGTLTLDGVPYAKGVGVHADSEIVVRLDGNYDRFISRIGLDDEQDGLCGDVAFDVDVDGANVYASGAFTDTSPTETVNLDVSGANLLTLRVLSNGDSCGDHADWADARLIPTVFPGYRYYRLTPTKLRDEGSADSVQLSEFSLYTGATREIAFGATNPGGNQGGNDSAGRANDADTNTRWRDLNVQPLVLDMGQNVEIDFYSITTANGNSERDPVRWLLEASEDGASWVVLDDQTGADYPVPTARRTEIAQIALGSLSVVTPLPEAPRHSMTVLVEDLGTEDRVWNVNPDNGSVSVIDEAGAVLAEIAVGEKPWSLAKQPGSDRIFVTNKKSSSVSVIDTVSLAVDDTFALERGAQPHGIVLSGDGVHYYVALETLGVVEKRQASDHALVGSVTVGGSPRHLSFTYDDARLLVSNFITPPAPGEHTATPNVAAGAGQVFSVDPAAMTVSNTIGLPHDGRGQSEVQGPGLPNYLGAAVVSFDGASAYVPTKKDNIQSGFVRGIPGMTFESTVRANTSRIDLGSELEDPTFRVDHDNSSVATGAALSGDDRYLFVALETSRELAIYDLQSGFELMRLPTGRAPQGVALSTDGSRAYVHNFLDRSISRFDLTEMLQKNLPATNLLSPVDVVGVEALTAPVLVGKQHFYDAADDRIARDNYISCASCHRNGEGDGRVWDLGQFGEGLRKTISLEGKGDGHGLNHWSGNFDEVQDFEIQIRALNFGQGFLTLEQLLAAGDPLGAPKAGLDPDLDALAAYVESLTETPESPYRPSAGAMSASAQAGQTEFAVRDCVSCHAPDPLTDSPLGLRHDIGTLDADSGQRLSGPLDGFDSPGLVGAWASPPYLHDGEAQTIEAAITAHDAFTSLPAGVVTDLANFLREAEPADAVALGLDDDADGEPNVTDPAPADPCVPNAFLAVCGRDSDGDGETDYAEGELADTDLDGTPDYLESSIADSDGDGLTDEFDLANANACSPAVFVAACGQDSDGDGATDFTETATADADGDGTPDYLESSVADADSDETPDQSDLADADACAPQVFVAACGQDSDGDGATDFAETETADSDADGTPDYLESSVADADADGTPDQDDVADADTCAPTAFVAVCAQDTDGDGTTDFAETETADSDGDGNPDFLESSVADADSDGTPNQSDADDANACAPQVFVVACGQDSDGDGMTDFVETEAADSDGDGTPDYLESSIADADSDGTPDQLDVADADACDPEIFVAACSQDTDGDGATDYAEGEATDSDGDGTPDYLESSLADADLDGVPDQDDVDDASVCVPIACAIASLPDSPRHSTTLLVEASTGADRIWNVNPDNDTVSVIDDTGTLLAEIPVGDEPWSLAKQPDGDRVYVTNRGSASITVIDTVLLDEDHTFDLPIGANPHGIVFSGDGVHYFVVLEALATLEKRLASDHALAGSLVLSGSPRHLSMRFDDSQLFVSNFITPPVPDEHTAAPDVANGAGEIFAIDPSTLTFEDTVTLPYDDRSQTPNDGPGLPNYVGAVVISFDEQFAYVPTKKDNLEAGQLRSGSDLTAESTVRANTSRINLATGFEDPSFRVDHDDSGVATSAALNGDGRYLFVTLETSRELAVYDIEGGFELMRLPTGRAPQSVALSTDGTRAYVHDFLDRRVSRFDLAEMLGTQLPATNVLPPTTVVGGEALSPTVLLGKQHFYDGVDDRLALDDSLSCASCHSGGGHDGRVWDYSQLGEGLRQTIALEGRGLGHGYLYWSGSADEVQDIEHRIRSLHGGQGFLTPSQWADTGDPLGNPKTGLSPDLDALAAYVASLTEVGISPYRDPDGTHSKDGRSGWQLFRGHGCESCHTGTSFSDSFEGVVHMTASMGPGTGPIAGLDTPTLRGLWATGPYLHDGSAATLEEAIDAHAAYVTTSLPASRKAKLVAYLLEIDDLSPKAPRGLCGLGIELVVLLPLALAVRRRRLTGGRRRR